MSEFLTSNEWQWRLLRTIVQGVLGVAIANLDLIMGWCVLDLSMRGLVVALVMAVFSPIIAAHDGNGDKPEIPRGEARGAYRHICQPAPLETKRSHAHKKRPLLSLRTKGTVKGKCLGQMKRTASILQSGMAPDENALASFS